MEKACIFCQIIQGEKPGDFVHQDDSVVAFKDRNPQAPVHILILPMRHIRSINDLTEDDRPVISDIFMRAKQIAAEMGTAREVVNRLLKEFERIQAIESSRGRIRLKNETILKDYYQ